MWYLSKKHFEEKEVQTIIQTKFTLIPAAEKQFQAALQYTPFQEIQNEHIKILNMSKKAAKHAAPKGGRDITAQCLKMDDDGVSEVCIELSLRKKRGATRRLQTFQDGTAQTSLHVYPHVLESDKVAQVITDSSTQTEVSSFSNFSTDTSKSGMRKNKRTSRS